MCEEMKVKKITWQELCEFYCQMATNESATAVDEKTLLMAEAIEEIFSFYGSLVDDQRNVYVKVDRYGEFGYHWEWKGDWAVLNSIECNITARIAQTHCSNPACSRQFTPQEIVEGINIGYVGRFNGDSRFGHLFECLDCAS